MKIKTFFYMIKNRTAREAELNDFLAQENIVVDQVLQSAATGSRFQEEPQYLDTGVIITVAYHEI